MKAALKFGLGVFAIYCVINSAVGSTKIHLASPEERVIPDQFLVTVQKNDFDGASQFLEQALVKNGVFLERKYVIGKAVILLVSGSVAAVSGLAASPDVALIESNRIIKVEEPVEQFPGNKPDSSHSTNHIEGVADGHPVCNTDLVGPAGWGIVRTSYNSKPDFDNDPYIWGEGDDGTDVDIYILDTGIRLTHDDFKERNVIWGFTANHSKCCEPEDDVHGHGTHVAGTAGGNRFGMARNSNLIAVKVHDQTGDGPISDVIEGLEWIVNDTMAKRDQGKTTRFVINMSLGFGPSYLLETAMQATIDAGVLVVNSAGNAAIDTCGATPGRMASVLSVAATNINDTLASFSNWGPCTDIMAPGRYIMSASNQNDQDYVIFSGTSMAAPHVAGAVARYLSVLSDSEAAVITPEMIIAHITDMGSRGSISLDDIGKQSTPDRLLYKKCERPNEEPSTTSSTTTSASTSTTASTTTTTTPAPTSPPSTAAPAMQTTWSTDDIGGMSLAALIMAAIVMTSSLGSLGLLYSSSSNM